MQHQYVLNFKMFPSSYQFLNLKSVWCFMTEGGNYWATEHCNHGLTIQWLSLFLQYPTNCETTTIDKMISPQRLKNKYLKKVKKQALWNVLICWLVILNDLPLPCPCKYEATPDLVLDKDGAERANIYGPFQRRHNTKLWFHHELCANISWPSAVISGVLSSKKYSLAFYLTDKNGTDCLYFGKN